jgi:hypothetical protein
MSSTTSPHPTGGSPADDNMPNEVIDIETFAKENRTPPPGRRYRIRVDKLHLEIDTSTITGREILRRASKQPVERYRLDQKLAGGRTEKIELDQVVDLTTPGVERFMTLPLDQTEGEPVWRSNQIRGARVAP